MHKAFRSLLFLLALKAIGQTFQGSLAGIVTDASNAAIPAATIRLESTTNGLRRSALSTTSGIYLFPELPVGIYTLTVTAKGFQDKKVDNIEIAVSKTTDLNVRLDVSPVSASADVTASPVALETTSSALVAVMDSKIVTDIPINGRDYRQMFLLAPGVAGVNSPNNPSLNGTRTEKINYQIDGVDNNDGKNIAFNQGLGSVYLPIESIDRLSVQSNAEADMGRNAGGNINVVVKSGTNTLHGSLCEFDRNEALRRTRRCSSRELRNRKFATIGSASRRARRQKNSSAALSVEDAAMIQRIVESGGTVRLQLRMEAHQEADAASLNVMGEIRGREKPEEVVVVRGHIDSWDVGQGARRTTTGAGS